jgi:predicted transcriptional regulator of viral defense system
MAELTRFKVAKKDIKQFFDTLTQKVFLKKDIAQILDQNRKAWRLPAGLYAENFIRDLISQADLKQISLYSHLYKKELVRYVWGKEHPIYQIALSINPGSFLSHYTAVYLHNLTQQIPKTIYVNKEQSPKPENKSALEQENIDRAFKGKGRTAQLIYAIDDWNICCLSGKNTGKLGVSMLNLSTTEALPVTTIERTLIDISVRPAYAGGVYEVLNAFKVAKGQFSVNTLFAYLKKINYKYPYHQVIGFYMERAGYPESQLKLARKNELGIDFYLDYGMNQTAYSKDWRLFFPKNF